MLDPIQILLLISNSPYILAETLRLLERLTWSWMVPYVYALVLADIAMHLELDLRIEHSGCIDLSEFQNKLRL